MKWSTHISIADKIFDEMIIQKFPDYKQSLRDGSIYPDKKDFKKRHHYGRESDIERNVEVARELRLAGSPEKALFRLGIALHYIQDRWTALDSSSPRHETHEQNIDDCPLEAHDSDLSGFYPVMHDECYHIYEGLSKLTETKLQDKETLVLLINYEKPYESNAFLDLNIAYRISYRVVEMVMDSIKSPELNRKLDECHERYRKRMAERQGRWDVNLQTIEEEYSRHAKSKGLMSLIRKKMIQYRKKREQTITKNDIASIMTDYRNECAQLSKQYSDWYKIPEPAEIKPEETLTHLPVSQDIHVIN